MEDSGKDPDTIKSLIIVFSYHHHNTEKIARAIAGVLGAPVKTPQQVTPGELAEYDLVGFGSGIYSGTFGRPVLALVDGLPQSEWKRAFLFSTYGAPGFVANREFVLKNHAEMRDKLHAKGYEVIGEFGCAGWNTNSFLKYFGGLNKGRPDENDLANAEAFARELRENAGTRAGGNGAHKPSYRQKKTAPRSNR